MRTQIILTSILLVLVLNLNGQTKTITGRIISEDFEELPKVSIQNIDTMLLGETDMKGHFKINIPKETEQLLLSYLGMEWTTINLIQSCDTIEIVMMYSVTYDFITLRKVDRLRLKRFKKLPEIHQTAYEKGIFKTKNPCYEQEFVAIKLRKSISKK